MHDRVKGRPRRVQRVRGGRLGEAGRWVRGLLRSDHDTAGRSAARRCRDWRRGPRARRSHGPRLCRRRVRRAGRDRDRSRQCRGDAVTRTSASSDNRFSAWRRRGAAVSRRVVRCGRRELHHAPCGTPGADGGRVCPCPGGGWPTRAHSLGRSRAGAVARRARRRDRGGRSGGPLRPSCRPADLPVRRRAGIRSPASRPGPRGNPGEDDRLLALLAVTGRPLAWIARRHRPNIRAIRGQSADVQRRIRTAFDRIVRPYRVGNRIEIPVSVKLASGRKPA